MQEEERKPKTQSAGAMPPPRPPTRTAIGLVPDGDDDDSIQRRRKKETVKINLPSKQPVEVPTIKLPMLPQGDPIATPSLAPAKRWSPDPFVASAVKKRSMRTSNVVSAALILILQAVLVFDAYTSVDRTTQSLFLLVALVLSIPGYMWAFDTSLSRAINTKPAVLK
jgi:hypothetical protein